MASLEACKPFRNLNPTEQAALRKIAVERSFSAGEQIFGEGDSGDGIYALKEGAVEISVAMSQNVRRSFWLNCENHPRELTAATPPLSAICILSSWI